MARFFNIHVWLPNGSNGNHFEPFFFWLSCSVHDAVSVIIDFRKAQKSWIRAEATPQSLWTPDVGRHVKKRASAQSQSDGLWSYRFKQWNMLKSETCSKLFNNLWKQNKTLFQHCSIIWNFNIVPNKTSNVFFSLAVTPATCRNCPGPRILGSLGFWVLRDGINMVINKQTNNWGFSFRVEFIEFHVRYC